jgi:hypothetical protein
MSLVRIPGGFWVPQIIPIGYGGAAAQFSTTGTVANDQEEIQLVGTVQMEGGAGTTKTFGTAGSAIGWLPATVTFNAVSTLRIGIKKAATFDNANGPPGRATAGTAAFDVYKDLVAGTDTITTSTWNNTAMASGSGFSVTQGDKVAVCFNLSKSSGTSSIQVRHNSSNASNQELPFCLTITSSGTVFTQTSAAFPNVRITFDDGTIGWIAAAGIFSAASTNVSIANGNIYGNVIQLPWTCTVDAIASIAAQITGDSTVGIWQTPNSAPSAMTGGTVGLLAKNMGNASTRGLFAQLPGEPQLTANTAYFAGVAPTTASGATVAKYLVDNVKDFQASGLDSNTFSALSTAGGAVAATTSGKERASIMVRVSQIDTGGGGVAKMAGEGGGFVA